MLYRETESALRGDGNDSQETIRPGLHRSFQAINCHRPVKLSAFPIGPHEERFLNHTRQSLFHKGVEVSPGSLLADSILLCEG